MSAAVFSFFQKNNGAHASEVPCQAGFSQSFYSVLVSRDVLKGGGVRKGEWHRRRPGLRFPAELFVNPLPGLGCVCVCVSECERERETLGVLVATLLERSSYHDHYSHSLEYVGILYLYLQPAVCHHPVAPVTRHCWIEGLIVQEMGSTSCA